MQEEVNWSLHLHWSWSRVEHRKASLDFKDISSCFYRIVAVTYEPSFHPLNNDGFPVVNTVTKSILTQFSIFCPSVPREPATLASSVKLCHQVFELMLTLWGATGILVQPLFHKPLGLLFASILLLQIHWETLQMQPRMELDFAISIPHSLALSLDRFWAKSALRQFCGSLNSNLTQPNRFIAEWWDSCWLGDLLWHLHSHGCMAS